VIQSSAGGCLNSAGTAVSVASCTDKTALFFWNGATGVALNLTNVVTSTATLPYTFTSTPGSATGVLTSYSDPTQCFSSSTNTLGACDGTTWTLVSPFAQMTGQVQFANNADGTVRVVANITGLLPAAAPYTVGLHGKNGWMDVCLYVYVYVCTCMSHTSNQREGRHAGRQAQ
jgi:hypothetical protein